MGICRDRKGFGMISERRFVERTKVLAAALAVSALAASTQAYAAEATGSGTGVSFSSACSSARAAARAEVGGKTVTQAGKCSCVQEEEARTVGVTSFPAKWYCEVTYRYDG